MSERTEFLVYSVELGDENETLESYSGAISPRLGRVRNALTNMSFDRVKNKEYIKAFTEDIEYSSDTDSLTGYVYKLNNPDKALHQIDEEGEEVTVQKILEQNENAFTSGIVAAKSIDGDVCVLVETDFGSFLTDACRDLELSPVYSADAIKAIKESETIGETVLFFDESVDLSAALSPSPEDDDARESMGFGSTDYLNKFVDLLGISNAYNVSLKISRSKWLDNIEMFEELINEDIVSSVRVDKTKNGRVRLGKGNNKSIREKVAVPKAGEEAAMTAFQNIKDDS